MIWNPTPKSGETASWSGDQDRENYASGFGDLTWYNTQGKAEALHYGNMVRGKFEGPVNLHTHGRTAHAYFADGGRVTSWARGPAPAKMKVPAEAIIERRKAEAASAAAARKEEIKSEEEKRVAAAAREPAKKMKAEPEKIQPVEPVESKPETTPEKSERTPSETPAQETAPTIVEKPAESTPTPRRAFDEPTALPKSEPDRPLTEPSQVPTPEPTQSASPEKESRREESVAKRTPADVSLNALVGPPSSLRTTSVPENASEKSETHSSMTGNASLTEREAVSLAEAEARAHGYHLEDYQPPKADHSSVKAKWTLFYSSKGSSTGSGQAEPFTVTVEDKTRKVEIRK